jgi:hypothetical protein
MEAAKVPQHLELDDVLAWGLSAVDLLCVVGGAGAGWWLYLVVPGELTPRVLVAAPAVLVGLAVGTLRLGELSLRNWVALALAYALRPRVLVTGAVS